VFNEQRTVGKITAIYGNWV